MDPSLENNTKHGFVYLQVPQKRDRKRDKQKLRFT